MSTKKIQIYHKTFNNMYQVFSAIKIYLAISLQNSSNGLQAHSVWHINISYQFLSPAL